MIDKVGDDAAFDPREALPAAEASLALLNVAHGLAAAYESANARWPRWISTTC